MAVLYQVDLSRKMTRVESILIDSTDSSRVDFSRLADNSSREVQQKVKNKITLVNTNARER